MIKKIFLVTEIKTSRHDFHLCQLAIAIFDRQKKVFASPVRHLLEQKFRIILNIVLIVNEFECFVLFPAAPIFLFASCVVLLLLLLCRSPAKLRLRFSGVGSSPSFFVKHLLFLFFCISYFAILNSLNVPYTEPQQKTLEAAWKKFSYVHERVSEREKKSRRKKKFPLTHSRIFPLCATVFGELELSKHTEENREKILRQLKKKRDDGEKSNGRLSRFESTIFLSIFLRTTS